MTELKDIECPVCHGDMKVQKWKWSYDHEGTVKGNKATCTNMECRLELAVYPGLSNLDLDSTVSCVRRSW